MPWAAYDASGRPIVINSTATPRISFTQNFLLQHAVPVQIGVLDSTGTTAASAPTNPFGSSLSLQAMNLGGSMVLTEVDLAFRIAFPATNQGAGTMSQSFLVYSFGNSTSLATVLSASRTVAWATGTTTTGTSSSLQQGWSGPNIQPFTFASSTLGTGNYAMAHLFSWAAASTSWSLSVYGAPGFTTNTASVVTAVTSASLGARSSGGMNAGSVFTATTSSAVSVFTATPTSAGVQTSAGLAAGSGLTGMSSYGSAFIAMSISNAVVSWELRAAPVLASSSTGTGALTVSLSSAATAKTVTFALVGSSSNSNILSSLGTVAGSIHTASTSAGVLSNSGTAGASILSSGGLLVGSFATATASFGAVTNVAVATAAGGSFALSSLPTFGYNGSFAMTTNTTQAVYQGGPLIAAHMATGSGPASIDLKSTAVTVTGSIALMQPWFALVGA